MKYKVYASLKEDINEGWCWITQPKLPSRSVVRIKNPAGGKPVYCEALWIEDNNNFLDTYNKRNTRTQINLSSDKNVIVINEWYRDRLGKLETRSEYELAIYPCNTPWAKFRACCHHPQIVVRLATWLAVLSIILGVCGLALGIVSLCNSGHNNSVQTPNQQSSYTIQGAGGS